MTEKKIFNLIENHKEAKNAFRNPDGRVSSPIKSQMFRFLQSNESQKDVLPGFMRFKPEDLR